MDGTGPQSSAPVPPEWPPVIVTLQSPRRRPPRGKCDTSRAKQVGTEWNQELDTEIVLFLNKLKSECEPPWVPLKPLISRHLKWPILVDFFHSEVLQLFCPAGSRKGWSQPSSSWDRLCSPGTFLFLHRMEVCRLKMPVEFCTQKQPRCSPGA